MDLLAGWHYTDSDVYHWEVGNLWPDSWIFAIDGRELPNPGDFRAVGVGNEPIFLVRDQDGELRAYANVCPHRGALLVDGSGNCGTRLTCPYHGWTFGTKGELHAAPLRHGFTDSLDGIGLTPIRVDSWQGLCFVNLSGTAPELTDWLEDLPMTFGLYTLCDVPLARHIHRVEPVNWKIYVNNFMDGYHNPVVHASTANLGVSVQDAEIRLLDATSTVYYPWPLEPPFFQVPGLPAGTLNYFVPPNFFLAGYPDGGLRMDVVTPVGLDRTAVDVYRYAYSPLPIRTPVSDQIFEEDVRTHERLAATIGSRFLRHGPVHRLEEQMRHFHRWYAAQQRHATSTTSGAGGGSTTLDGSGS